MLRRALVWLGLYALPLAPGAAALPLRQAAPPKGKTPVTIPKRTVPVPKPAPEPEIGAVPEFPIATLAVEGNVRYPAPAILHLAGLKPGDRASKPAFEAARDRLLATGAFDSVGYRYFTAPDGRSYEAVFQVVESGPLYPFRLDGIPGDAGELTAFLRAKDPLYGPQLAATSPRISQYAAWIQEFAQTRGLKGTVVGKVEADAPGELTIIFRPEGNPPVVADVTFRGNLVVPSQVLKPAILGVALGVPFQEGRFRQLLDNSLRPIYEARGRLTVEFPKIAATPSADVRGLNVEVTVNEGEVFQLGELQLLGPGIPEAELRRVADFRSGDVANFQAVEEGIERMRRLLRRNGYLAAVLTPKRTLHLAEKRVDLTVEIQPGDQYHFRRLKVEGLDIQSEPVIRKMWALAPGDPMNPDYPEIFLKRIEADQVFDNLKTTRSELRLDAETRAADVVLLFGKAAETRPILKK